MIIIASERDRKSGQREKRKTRSTWHHGIQKNRGRFKEERIINSGESCGKGKVRADKWL